MSSESDLPESGPQGSNSNSNADHIQQDIKFRFVDDLSVLEKLNFKNHLISDIDDKFLPTENYQPRANLNQIADWTRQKTISSLKGSILKIILNEIVNQTKMLGTIVSSGLKWSEVAKPHRYAVLKSISENDYSPQTPTLFVSLMMSS